MHIARRFNDELPILYLILLLIVAVALASCTSAAERRQEARDHAYRMKVMAEDWAWNGVPPPAGFYYNAPAWNYPPPAAYQQPRMRTMCMQYGTLGQGGQVNCY